MQRFWTAIMRSIPLWVIILIFYSLGGLAVGLGAYIVGILLNNSLSLPFFAGIGCVVGLVLGIWVVIER